MYYALIFAATVLFGLQFFFNKLYQKGEGDGISSAMIFAFLNALVCAAEMFCLNRFVFSFSFFSMGVALLCGLNNILYAYSSVKALGKADLATFSLFAMLGGMILPFIGGIIFWNEKITALKIICCLLIIFALWLGTDRGSGRKGAAKYYIMIFIFNGMSGILSKLHQSGDRHVTEQGYMLLSSICAMAISGAVLIYLKVIKKQKIALNKPGRSIPSVAVYSVISGVGNLFLLIALSHVDASVQYPFVTGGTIVVSAIISAIIGEKPGVRKLIAIAVAFTATLILIF